MRGAIHSSCDPQRLGLGLDPCFLCLCSWCQKVCRLILLILRIERPPHNVTGQQLRLGMRKAPHQLPSALFELNNFQLVKGHHGEERKQEVPYADECVQPVEKLQIVRQLLPPGAWSITLTVTSVIITGSPKRISSP